MTFPRTVGLSVFILVAGVARASAGFDYVLDDGSGNWTIGPSAWDAEVLWGNVFNAEAGFETIDTISVSFGGSTPLGRPFSFVLFEDPNDDLDPTDAIPLAQVTGVTEATAPNEFVPLSITPTRVSGSFFVACVMELFQHESPARMDPDTSVGRSWIFFDDAIDLDHLGDSPLYYNMAATPFNGTWMVRAHGVPEPASLSLPLVAATMLVKRPRRGLERYGRSSGTDF